MPLILPSLTPSALDATAVVGVMRYCTSLHYADEDQWQCISGRRGAKRVKEKSEFDLIEVEFCLSGFHFFTSSVSKPPQTEQTQHPPTQSHVMSLVVSWKLVSIRKMFCTVCYFRVLGLNPNLTVLALLVVDVGDHEGRR